MDTVLEVQDLRTQFFTPRGIIRAVDGVSFSVPAGEIVAVVGESGSGKTVLGLSILRLVPRPGRIVSGHVLFQGTDLLGLHDRAMQGVRGDDLAMTFQDAMTSLNPLTKIGAQIKETMTVHGRFSPKRADAEVVPLMRRVHLPAPDRRAHHYPHQLSGGMRQRVMIGMGVANRPDLLIADEATTALDVTTQAQVVRLLEQLNAELGSAILLITHNMGLVARLCDRMIVMYAGRIVEEGPVEQLFDRPQHPYTWSLIRSVPRVDGAAATPSTAIHGAPPDLGRLPSGCTFHPRCLFRIERCSREEPPLAGIAPHEKVRCWLPMESSAAPERAVTWRETSSRPDRPEPRVGASLPDDRPVILQAVDVTNIFPATRAPDVPIRAVDGVSFDLRRGETLGLIGESGCGKSTLARIACGLLKPTSGRVLFEGEDLGELHGAARRRFRREVQVIFQDPFSSLDPRMNAGQIVAEPLVNFRVGRDKERRARVATLLELVGLDPDSANRFPHEFSGGQRQRIGIARALALDPSVIVCDEPVSALDVSTQAQIVNLLADLQRKIGLAYLFISHDLAVVRSLAERIAVMYLGSLVEVAAAEAVFRQPQHPYTRALLDAIPIPDPRIERTRERVELVGEPTADVPPGCRFHPRCPVARRPGICESEEPLLQARGREAGRFSACHFPLDVSSDDGPRTGAHSSG